MKVHHKITVCLLAASLASCSFLFGRSSTSEVVANRSLKGTDSHLVAIKECGLTSRQSMLSLARVRELFVGFSQVRVYDYQKVILGDRHIDRAYVHAALEGDSLHAVTYLLPLSNGCTLDVVVWNANHSDPAKIDENSRMDVAQVIEEAAPA